MDNITVAVERGVSHPTRGIPALLAFVCNVSFSRFTEGSHGISPLIAVITNAHTNTAVGSKGVGEPAFDKGGMQAAGKMLKSKGLLELANGDCRRKAGVLNPGIANAASGCVCSAWPGKVILKAIIPVFVGRAAHVQKQAAHAGAATKFITLLLGAVSRGIQLQPTAELKAEVVTAES